MFILYNGKAVVFIPLENVEGMTCDEVYSIITGTHNDTELGKIGFYDVCKKSIKVQKAIKRNQISTDYLHYLQEVCNIA